MSKIKEAMGTALALNEAETKYLLAAAQQELSFERLLRFKKGVYEVGGETVPIGSEFLAHTTAWTKCWIKFRDKTVVDRKTYCVARNEKPPQREELDDNDETKWPRDPSGKPTDPWVYQFLLPLENLKTSEVVIFTTSSIGGRIAVGDLTEAYANRAQGGRTGQPIVTLEVAIMPTKNFGPVQRPKFQISGWDDAANTESAPKVHTPEEVDEDMDDRIPF